MHLLSVHFMVFISLCRLYLSSVIAIHLNIDFLTSVYNVLDNQKKKMECENLLLLKNRLFFLQILKEIFIMCMKYR